MVFRSVLLWPVWSVCFVCKRGRGVSMCNVSVTSGAAVACGRCGLCVGVIWVDGPHFGSGVL